MAVFASYGDQSRAFASDADAARALGTPLAALAPPAVVGVTAGTAQAEGAAVGALKTARMASVSAGTAQAQGGTVLASAAAPTLTADGNWRLKRYDGQIAGTPSPGQYTATSVQDILVSVAQAGPLSKFGSDVAPSTWGGSFGNYHASATTFITVGTAFTITDAAFAGDDGHGLYINDTFVVGDPGYNPGGPLYTYTFAPGSYKIEVLWNEGDGGDFGQLGWSLDRPEITAVSSGALSAVPPGTPTNPPSATAGNGQISLALQAVADGGSAITSYEVETTPGSVQSVGLNLTPTVTGLTNGTSYTFRYRAVNAVGTGGWSPASATVTPTAAAPAGPVQRSLDLFNEVSDTPLTSHSPDVGEVWIKSNGNEAVVVGGAGYVRNNTTTNSGGARWYMPVLIATEIYEVRAKVEFFNTATFSAVGIAARRFVGDDGQGTQFSYDRGAGGFVLEMTGGTSATVPAAWPGGVVDLWLRVSPTATECYVNGTLLISVPEGSTTRPNTYAGIAMLNFSNANEVARISEWSVWEGLAAPTTNVYLFDGSTWVLQSMLLWDGSAWVLQSLVSL